MEQHAVIAVWMNGSVEHDREFHDWYETEHLAVVVAIDGILGAQRYFNAHGDLPYLVFYDATDETVERGPGFQKMLANPTLWTVRIRNLCQKPSRRSNFRIRHDTGRTRQAGAILTIYSADRPMPVARDTSQEVPTDCLRQRLLEDANRPGAWLEVYDFRDITTAAAARLQLAIGGDSRIDIYQAVGTPKERASEQPSIPSRGTGRRAAR